MFLPFGSITPPNVPKLDFYSQNSGSREWNKCIMVFTTTLFVMWKIRNNLNTYRWKIVK